MPKTLKSLFITITLFFGWILMIPGEVSAGCDYTFTPSVLYSTTYDTLTFNVESSGDNDILWVKVNNEDNEGSDVQNTSASSAGWTLSDFDWNYAIFGGNLPVDGNDNFLINLYVKPIQDEGYTNWSVQTSESADGSNSEYCDGPEDTIGRIWVSTEGSEGKPVITGAVARVGTTTVTIEWVTSLKADSVVEYGLTSSYGSTASDASQVLAHSVTLEGLTEGTTYNFKIKSTGSAGNPNETLNNTFVTNTTESVTTVTTVTIEADPVAATEVIKTVIIRDTTKPVVAITSDIGGVYEKAPTIKGKASDGKGVMRVHYSVDGGRNWLPVDEIVGEEKSSATFSFTPLGLLDGNYEVIVRAYDPTANIGFSDSYEMVIDRLPPRVGSILLTIGSQIMKPTSTGLVYGLQGINQGIILSSVGGATSIDLISDPILSSKVLGISESSDLSSSQQMYSLSKNTETGLWFGVMNFANPGLYQIVARAEDGANNKTERELQSVYVLPNGKIYSEEGVVTGAEVKVFVKNPNTNRFVMWDGEAFLQKNPQTTNNEGKYGLILPPGKYYLEARLKGHKLLRTPIFSLTDHTPINTDFSLEKLATFKIFGREFFLPTWKKTVVPVSIKQVGNEYIGKGSDLVGRELPFFILKQGDSPLYSSDLVGKPTVVSFLTTWSPLASEQMKTLDSLRSGGVRTVAIFEQETLSGVSLFMKRGGYETEVWADEDGELVEDFSIYTTPTHLFIDSKGMVRDVVVGFLDGEKMIEKLYK